MTWLPITILAQVILGTSAVLDKVLLKRAALDPYVYTFWFGVLGLFSFVLTPFGFELLSPRVFLYALAAGITFEVAMLFLFTALARGHASGTLPLIGGLSPLATLAAGSILLPTALTKGEMMAFLILVFAAFLLFLTERHEFRHHAILYSLASAGLLGITHTLSKLVFEETTFVSGFIWVKIGGLVVAGAFLLIPSIRERIFRRTKASNTESKFWYLANRGFAGVGSLFVSYAIFLGHPALVDVTQGLRYVVIFAAAWIILHERFRGKILFGKILATILVVIGLAWLSFSAYMQSLPPVDSGRSIFWGVTFSQKFSEELNLDWRENYRAILNELKPAGMRLVAHWDRIEPEQGVFSFEDLDWQVNEAEARAIPYILAIGMKTPRWPECHIPPWAQQMNTKEREEGVRQYVSQVVRRYRDREYLLYWQVENEPFLLFGQCPERGEEFLKREIGVVRSLDSSHLVLTTDGGEFGDWVRAARHGDVFGTTMYRKVFPRIIGPIFGVIEYPLPPEYFRIKEQFVRWINGSPDQRFIVIELQGEPWEQQPFTDISKEQLMEDFSPEYFRDSIDYAKVAGFDEYYVWGVEWWWLMNVHYGEKAYWNIARELFGDR